ncbi:PPOX class F420-dependent oxidoreductase [Nocardia amamiensis]|uniref:PPOX class F420-dependent oxidoreductase n=1 Tax=Nocardia amamiensis TaxID=404578 RepID=A0ABS0CY36_9NOCA|nr:PPOX class F420-dependent oxidoreductase [Nocardia amamiensis]MBF6300692.1 PPOX class F420-dependent oxidoreductase [Nocardia amamiensis]
MTSTLTPEQIDYLHTQRLGRLATVRPDGTPQNNPVGFRYNADLGTIDIAGWNMGASRKFRNLTTNSHVAFVVDDIASVQPWRVRCLEIRGTAEALTDVDPYIPGVSREMIRIRPDRVIAFGLTEEALDNA